MSRRLPQADPRAWHRGALHHPRPRRRRPDRRPDHGAAGAARWSSSATRGKSCRSRGRNIPAAWSPSASRATISSTQDGAAQVADPRHRPCQRQLSRQAAGHRRRERSRCARATRSPWSANRARANRRSPASSPASCRASAGDVRFNGASLPARLRPQPSDQLRRVQMIYQMPDVALNPQHTLLETIGRPVAFYFSRSRERRSAPASAELLRQMDLPEKFITRKTSEFSGRTEAARLDRPGAGRRARSDHLRRSDVGARPTGRRGDPAAAEEAAGRPRRRLSCSLPTTSAR